MRINLTVKEKTICSDQNLEYNAPTVLILRQKLKHYTTGGLCSAYVSDYLCTNTIIKNAVITFL